MNTITGGLSSRQRLVFFGLVSITLIVIGTAALVAAPPSTDLSETTPLPTGKEMAVTGEVVMIEGNVQIVKDRSGKQRDVYMIMEHLYVAQIAGDEAIQFHVNEETRMDEELKIGDKVEVLAAQNGEALSIKKTE
ncbi:MAG TPA: hypothetical protein VKP13_09135 [Nitrospira sp.]|nr:hypothetical protein [Nitrospira sp.]